MRAFISLILQAVNNSDDDDDGDDDDDDDDEMSCSAEWQITIIFTPSVKKSHQVL